MPLPRFSTYALATALIMIVPYPVRSDSPHGDIPIVNGSRITLTSLKGQRVALGIPNDYKPWLAPLKNGQLLLVAFCFDPYPGVEGYCERAVFWRSDDGGQTWGPRQERLDIHGREFSPHVLHDGTLLMPCHFLSSDQFNKRGHTYSKVFRSTDHGETWSEQEIGPEGFPPGANTATDWSVFQLPTRNPDQWLTCFGVSMQHGEQKAPEVVRLWRSSDSGKTWDKSLNPDTRGWIDVDGFFSQSTTYVNRSEKLFHPVRVDRTGPHWHIPGTPDQLKTERGDNGDRMMLWTSLDQGASWDRHRETGSFGYYGEMYPRFLRLHDGRLLLTFTVRSNSTDGHGLGLRAIISDDDGETWNFKKDRIVISYVNSGASGGGFGNTVQLSDGTLLSAYSYRDEKEKTHIETVRWRLPDTP